MRSLRLACASSAQRRPWRSCTGAARPTSRARPTSTPNSTTWMRTADLAISLVRAARSRDQDDLAVARQVQPQPRLRPGDEDGAALGGADAALEIGAVPGQVGAPGPEVGEAPGRGDGSRIEWGHQPRGDGEGPGH